MSFLDKAKDLLGSEQAEGISDKALDGGLDKVGEIADEKTGGKFSDKIDEGIDIAREKGDEQLGNE
ncbi:antitoxin [Nocardioides sp. NPDC126508]